MSSVVFAAPPYMPDRPKVPNPFSKLSMFWTGVDGSEWSLSDYRTGVLLLRDGVEGLHFPAFEEDVAESPSVDGQRYLGGRAKAQNVEWPIEVWADSSTSWKDIEQAWWRSFFPVGETGTWTVQSVGGETRRLKCRMTSDGGYAHTKDPQLFGWVRYPVSLMADDPFWLGDPITREWRAPDPRRFFGGDLASNPTPVETAPPFYISAQTSFDTATMPNPGDVVAWPVWTFIGPATDTLVTVDGGPIGIPDLVEGDVLVFDTHPARGQALLNGVNADHLIDPWDPRPIPAMSEAEVTVQMSQLGELRCEVTPAYYRAF